MRWITDSFQESVEEILPRTIEELEELQSVDNSLPGMSSALPVLEDSIDPNKAESELLKERIMSIMENDEPKLTFVEVGLQDFTFAEILSGVEAGDIVTTGLVETE